MDLIYTNPSREDVGVLHNYELDLAFGSGENNFECVVGRNDHHCEFGSFLYIEGTEYGGIVDSVESKGSTQEVVYSGRTWHGILNSKVLEPDPGEDYLICSGEANAVIASLLTRMGLSGLFEASSEDSGLTVKKYKMNRYINGYDGIRKMLKTVDAKLRLIVQNNGQVLLSAVPIVDYAKDELDSDLISLDVKQTAKTVNHLICLGQGNLSERLVIHLYADENGNISQTQTISGMDEYVAVFEYPNAESEADLLESGIDRLKELMQQDDLSVDVNDVGDPYDVGDLVGATDNITNTSIKVPITKKIVTIKNGIVTIDIKTETGNVSEHASETASGGNGLPGADGQDGQDGISCTHEWNGTVLTVTSASGTSSADLKGETGAAGKDGSPGKDGYTPQKGVDYFDGNPGANGKDGVSVTHSWNGTTLTVTSASGTSSANLKGEKGDKGDPGTVDISLLNAHAADKSQHISRFKRDGLYTGTATWYFPFAKFPINDGSNYCSIIVNGRIGYWTAAGLAKVDMVVTNRGGVYAAGAIRGNATKAFEFCDIVIYNQDDNSAIAYIKAYNCAEFDLSVDYVQASNIFDNTYTLTPTGTLVWSLSTAKSIVKSDMSGSIYANGGTMTDALTLSGAPTADLHAATKAYVDNAVASSGGSTEAMTAEEIRAICT